VRGPLASGVVEHVEVGAFRIAYRRMGNGPPVVLLHGGLSDSREWRRQLEDLSDQFTVVAWDAPGCGGSSDPDDDFRLPGYADVLASFVDALELERPCVVGLSFGAGLALELYRQHPQVPASLILASAYAGWVGSLAPETVEERLRDVLRQAKRPADEVVAEWLPSLFAAAPPTAIVDEIAAIMRDFHPAGMRAMAYAFAEADLRDVLPRIDVPTLILYGGADRRSPLGVAEALHAAIPNSTLVVLDGVGHQSNVEAPDRFNAAMRSFLRETDGGV
jgi:pimeloyl-ACP methyl ester carboxylesterase